jgi:hypothetical protein
LDGVCQGKKGLFSILLPYFRIRGTHAFFKLLILLDLVARPKGFEPQTSASGVWKNGVFIGSWCKKTLVLRCGALVWTGIVFHTPSILFHTRVLAKKNGEAKQHKNRRWARKIKAKA